VTQHGLGPVRQNGSNEDTAPIEPAVTDGEYPSVQTMKPSPSHPRLHGVGFEPKRDQLPQGNHSVLALGQFGYLSVTWMWFPAHVTGKASHV
jgi:hypothetical protein